MCVGVRNTCLGFLSFGRDVVSDQNDSDDDLEHDEDVDQEESDAESACVLWSLHTNYGWEY